MWQEKNGKGREEWERGKIMEGRENERNYFEQGWTQGYPSRVRVGRTSDKKLINIWAGAVISQPHTNVEKAKML